VSPSSHIHIRLSKKLNLNPEYLNPARYTGNLNFVREFWVATCNKPKLNLGNSGIIFWYPKYPNYSNIHVSCIYAIVCYYFVHL
jgi:hypothetical protein